MKNNQHDQHVIAIGASVGGMDAMETFFKNTPLDNVSYVIVQHLSEDHKSHLAELLSRHSKLAVCEAIHNMEVESNKVYVIPNRQYMTIDHRRLQLVEKQKKDSPHKTINAFFQSLASDLGDKAIGIILSGSGSDGVDGIEAIKRVGGLVLVQEPSSALNHEMPDAAIASQMVDMVLSPDAMPKAIADYVSNVSWGFPVLPNRTQGNDHIRQILGYLKDHYPVDFSEYKSSTISRRIERRMAANHVNTVPDYLNFMKENPRETEVLAHHFLISVTSFFRDKKVFALLEKEVIPDIISQSTTGFKAWVAACATGEEAYSLAILVKEYLDKNHLQMPVRIFATDIDDHALGIAGKGLFSAEELKNVSPARLKRFFIQKENKFQVEQEIREMLIFAHHDLVKNAPYCQVDLISCRNVLIYMKPPLQKKVLSMLHFGLKTNGYLVVGQSENVESMGASFSEFNKKLRVFQKTNVKRSPHLESFIPQLSREGILRVSDNGVSKPSQTPGITADHVNELLLDEIGYAGVCTDKELNVLKTYGDLSRFLLSKILTFNLRDLLPDTLAVAVGTSVKKALKLNRKVAMQHIPVTVGTVTMTIDLVVKPVNLKSQGTFLIVLFHERQQISGTEEPAEHFDLPLHLRELYEEMEVELNESRAELAEAYAKIDAAETNVQSFNEELLSANEELQSANEEMQSVNEELQTINNERLQKIHELTELNDDLDNYFRSNLNGQIFVNNELILMKYSPTTAEYLNLVESDIGRPLTRLSTNFRFDTLIGDIRQVIEKGGSVVKQAQSDNGSWFQVMVMPYVRKEGNRHDGAIITFADITTLKNSQEELALSNQSLLRINDDLHNFVYTASHDLSGPISNIEITIDMLRKDFTDPPAIVKRQMEILKNSVVKFRMVMKELSEIAKIEGETMEPDVISLKTLLEEVRLSILDKIVESDAVIKARFEVKEIPFAKKNMRSIFYNLISNAIKFRSDDRAPVIQLKTSYVPNFVLLSVSDNGIGMEKNQQERVFKMYHRLTTQREGSGIGLYLVKKIIDASGGKVEVESEPGKGTTFHLYFKR